MSTKTTRTEMAGLNVFVILHCCQCGGEIDVPKERLPLDSLVKFLAADGWLLSLVSPPGERNVRMAVLCPDCAKQVIPPAVLEIAKEHHGRRRS